MLIAIDTGATKTLIASISSGGKILSTTLFPTPKKTTEYVTNLQKSLAEIVGNKKPEAIVVALPGLIKEGVALTCPNLGWVNFDVRPPLAAHFPDTPIFIENDANLAGLGETRLLKPMPDFSLYVTISTGIGTGFTTNGRIDPSLRLSEGGSISVEYDSVTRRWESFASGSSIHKTYGKYARDITSKRTWNQIADRISRGFLAIIPLVQPDVIIIGGSIGTYFDQYRDQLHAILQEKLPTNVKLPPIIQAKHPEQAVIYGCYYHAIAQSLNKTAS